MRRHRLFAAVPLISVLLLAAPLYAGAYEDAEALAMDCLSYAERLVRQSPSMKEEAYLTMIDSRMTVSLDMVRAKRSAEEWDLIMSELQKMARPLLSSIFEIKGRSMLYQAEKEKAAAYGPRSTGNGKTSFIPGEMTADAGSEDRDTLDPENTYHIGSLQEPATGDEAGTAAPGSPERGFEIGGMLGVSSGVHVGYVSDKWQTYAELGYNLTQSMSVAVGGDYIFHFGRHSLMTGGAISLLIGSRVSYYEDPDYGYPGHGYPDYGYPDYGYPDSGYPGHAPLIREETTEVIPFLSTRIGYTYAFNRLNIVLGGYLGLAFNLAYEENGDMAAPVFPDAALICSYRF